MKSLSPTWDSLENPNENLSRTWDYTVHIVVTKIESERQEVKGWEVTNYYLHTTNDADF